LPGGIHARLCAGQKASSRRGSKLREFSFESSWDGSSDDDADVVRSAGVERLGSTDFLGRNNTTGEIQLSYRAEMANIFLDLAIDLGLRHSPAPADIA